MQAHADLVVTKSCKKLIVDLHYEARIQAIVTYHGLVLGQRLKMEDARTMHLT
jgi:azurin